MNIGCNEFNIPLEGVYPSRHLVESTRAQYTPSLVSTGPKKYCTNPAPELSASASPEP